MVAEFDLGSAFERENSIPEANFSQRGILDGALLANLNFMPQRRKEKKIMMRMEKENGIIFAGDKFGIWIEGERIDPGS